MFNIVYWTPTRTFKANDFDVSTLLSIIRNGKVLDQQDEPTDGWGKPKVKAANMRKGDDIERIRLIRNSLCHNPLAAMDESDFNTFIIEMKNIAHRWYIETGNLIPDIEKIVGIALSGSEINEILQKFVDETKHEFVSWYF